MTIHRAARRFACILAAAAFAVAPPAWPQCKDRCAEPAAGDFRGNTYRIDAARSGVSIQDKLHDGAAARVVIYNKNPFRYRYIVTERQRELGVAVVTDFFKAVPGLGPLVDQVFGAAAPPPPAPKAPFCPADPASNKAFNAYTSAIAEAAKESGSLKKVFQEKDEVLKQYNRFLDDTAGDSIACETACETASQLLAGLDKVLSTKAEADRVEKLGKTLAGLEDQLKAVQAAVGAIDPSRTDTSVEKKPILDVCKAQLAGEEKTLAATKATLAKDIEAFRAALKTIQDESPRLARFQTLLRAVVAGREAFVEVRTFDSSAGAKNVQVAVARVDLRTDNAQAETLANLNLDIGSVPLSVSLGFGFSTLDEVKIVRQAASDGQGGVVTIFGYQHNSRFRPSGVALLTGHLKSWRDVTLGASAGLVVLDPADSAGAEFILGPSLGFRSNLIWLTGGLHLARVRKLAGGFSIGDRVPAALQDPLPIESNYKPAFMFSLTFKVR
jgi:hypothetical protein